MVEVLLTDSSGDTFPVSLFCGSADRRNRERVVDFNAVSANVTQFLVARNGQVPVDCAPMDEPLTLQGVCPAGSPNAALTIR